MAEAPGTPLAATMLIDARTLSSGSELEADICIVGAGAAGISLAREFAGAQLRVILLEGGGLKFEHRSQFLNRGEVRGRSDLPLENTRRRQFGGTTAVWFGRCRALDAIDFEHRSWLPYSGWPFSKAELDPYFSRADQLCQIPALEDRTNSDALAGSGLERKLFYFSPPTHFGQAYAADLLSAGNIQLAIHANAISIDLDEAGRRATSILSATLNRNTFRVRARYFILAMGGLENPRLLLNSRDRYPAGIGNGQDLVGRFFMEHIYMYIAAATSIPPSFPPEYLRLNYESFQRNLEPTPAIGLPESFLRDQHLLNTAAFFVRRPIYKTDDRFYSRQMQGFLCLVEMLEHRRAHSWQIIQHLRQTAANRGTVFALMKQALRGKLGRLSEFGIYVQAEPVPNRESRVQLSSSRDALGVNRISVEWQLSAQDLESIRRFEGYLLSGLEKCGVSLRRLQLDRDAEGWPVSMPASKHHMGTTRMSTDPRQGVVDENCRVHGISNLYMAGSSVFPTAGMANPTLTLIALAVRLADHIKQALR
jgi:choline dehydrogenase-like flavoprotein